MQVICHAFAEPTIVIMTETMNDADLSRQSRRRYERRLVAFVDILGFKNLIGRTLQNPLAFELTYSLLETLSRRRHDWDASEMVDASEAIAMGFVADEQEHEAMVAKLRARNRVIAFSDNIVLSAPFDWGGVSFVLAAASTLSLELLRGGVLARGGIAEGLLVHEDNLVFGPGLIRAWEIESKTAQFPRVVLDSVAENRMMEMIPEDPSIAAVVGNLLRTDGDQMTHLHILGRTAMCVAGLLSERQRLLALVPEFLQIHHRAALKDGSQAIAEKVSWFADYYNHTIGREPETGLKPVCLQSRNGDSWT